MRDRGNAAGGGKESLSQKPAEDHGRQPVGECQKLKRITSFRVPRASARGYLLLAVCSSAKTCEIGENLLSVSDPISRPEERLIHAGALIRPPTLQRRPVSNLHPYAAVERS